MKPKACLIIEQIAGNIRECAWELASLAQLEFFRETYDWIALIAGNNIERAATLFAEKTGIEVYALCDRLLENFSGEGFVRAYSTAVQQIKPYFIFASHTPLGCDVAPALAIVCNMDYFPSLQCLTRKNEILFAYRERLNGKINEEITITEPAICTIMPGVFPIFNTAKLSGKVSIVNIDTGKIKSIPAAPNYSPQSGAELSNAEVIVSAGRGVGNSENMEHLRNLASLFSRAAIGGSRAACDMGLVDYGLQIGVTGRIVSPKLYFACGISGSAQHIAGMKNARTIVAINRDESAPIFRIADIGVIDEVEKFIPVFIEFVQKK
ncbi:MAG: electron transfer flavoprotein subunit alpha/FixB family protein [Spirochaetes bacterium]|nr:electron transfer flavoprotein subunit alpha/FixB family protein [Spirochaetota bacterium]